MTATPRDSITLRDCTDADVPFLRHLYGTTREDELRPVPWSDEEKRGFLDMQFSAQKAHYETHYPDCTFQVIELDAQPIGRLYVHRGQSEIRVVDIALLPEFHGRGIAHLLMTEILEEARPTDRAVTLHVERDNPARHLYDRLGFRQVDTHGIYDLMEWRAAGPAAAAGHEGRDGHGARFADR